MTEEKRIKCPFCAEEILPEAKKCRYCGEWLEKIDNTAPKQKDIKTANEVYYQLLKKETGV